jgi:hypothetical protein
MYHQQSLMIRFRVVGKGVLCGVRGGLLESEEDASSSRILIEIAGMSSTPGVSYAGVS